MTRSSFGGARAASLWRRAHRGWPRSCPIVMLPNIELVVGGLAAVGSGITSGAVSDILTAISRVALVVWACLELVDGGNLFRRALGLGFLIFLAIRVLG